MLTIKLNSMLLLSRKNKGVQDAKAMSMKLTLLKETNNCLKKVE